jgi:hypothetical protein
MRLQQVAERAAEHGCKPMGKAENTNDKQNSGIGGSISMEADPLPRPAEKKNGVPWSGPLAARGSTPDIAPVMRLTAGDLDTSG